MDRAELQAYITDIYYADAETPWAKYPGYMVFRHSGNRKWFAVIMDVPKAKLGLNEAGTLDILNVKCDPAMIASFRTEPGIFPAYHMNKANWLSVALDGSVDDGRLKLLLDQSFVLTAPKAGRHKPPQ